MKQYKEEIIKQIARLSRLLSMIPSDDAILIHEPLTQDEMVLSDWIKDVRSSFLKLSAMIGRDLDVPLR